MEPRPLVEKTYHWSNFAYQGRKSPVKQPKSKSRRKTPADAVAPRIARRERRRERSREEIVAAARRVLLEKGIAGTTLDAVAEEVGLTKAALYYYYPSKDALLFEIMYATLDMQTAAVGDAVGRVASGGEALRAIIAETVRAFAPRLDDFRLTFLHGQVAKPGTVRITKEQLARIRPLNDRTYGGAAKLLAQEWKRDKGRAGVEPRLMAFLAGAAAIGLLTMKGLVESFDDPLLYTDEQLIEGFARIFEAAAAP
jgi:AcrR family transcriptional regulator